ncbi:FAD-binding domain-containing protein [Aaosphaeria arxii CBS 175.79]|uniref:FAD-binding domain-containing protein n=1 Tax=Aaosphaeria arxii CBS 175.79 TaxID=1450172 RepID=A0A6A5XE61_9PLEO|nr:FAD-binding domain-containing protein [Aaosphaeria arxii CBS 175.79]KAF2011161.1 FAD-binding domain-containing protein [Aaosphaeria arxii CBS 175.79]
MSCLQKNRVEFIAQGDAKYNELSTPYNTRIRTRPRIIITPNRVSDIQYAVVCAQREGFKVQPRAGGHSYAGYSTGDANTLIIDLRYISNVEYDPRSRKAFAFGGARLGNLGLKLGADGKAISHGDCPGVGLAGHSLHGGFGYTSRMWGLSTDHILSMKVVTATGDLVSASPKLNSDLFYAMKGAGDSFGIAVEFELKTRTVPDKVLRFIFDLARYSRDAKRMADVFVNVQACVQSRSFGDNYGLTIRLATDAFRVAGYFYGKEADFQRTMLPCLSKAAPVTITIEEQSFSRSLSSIAGDAPLRRFIDAPGAKSNFYAKSVMIPEQRPLNKAQMQDYFRTVLEAGARVPNQFVITFRLMGGTGSHVKKDYGDTSIPWRDTLWIAQHDGQTQRNPRDVARAITAMNDQLEGSIQRNVATYFMFPPFIDPDLTREESHKMYLGDEHSRRLQRIKTKWDPTNVFSNPQSVQLERRR